MTWQLVRQEFERLCDLPPAAVAARLSELETTDRWLAEQVRDLLRQDAEQPNVLERTPPPHQGAEAVAFAAPGLHLGRFELLRPLGSGGMGAVWEARQADPERRVAIKLVVRNGRSEGERWRFAHEVQVLAQLRHPAIATLFEAGEDEVAGSLVSWFAMELVDGATDLLTWSRQRELSRDARLQLFERLCEAVDHGHRHGVLHRDLKPGNVLVDRDGRLQLIDFGVARALTGDQGHLDRTHTGEILGTLQFMAPEQLRGDRAAIGVPADVYALGVILYQLLCDRPPYDFDGVPFARIATIVLEQEPRAPTAVVPDLPPDLGWIVLHALAKDPAQRYATVRDLLDDLRRWRSHEPVLARAPSRRYRTRKFLRRHRVAVGVGATLTVGLGVGVAFLVHGLQRARTGELAAVRGADLAREVTRVTVAMFDRIDDTVASRDVKVHELLDAGNFEPGTYREPAVEFATRELRGRIYARLSRFAEARRELELAAPLLASSLEDVADAAARQEKQSVFAARLGRVLVGAGERERGERMLRDAVVSVAQDRPRTEVLLELCMFLSQQNLHEELFARAGELRALATGLDDVDVRLRAQSFQAQAASGLGRNDEAVELAANVYQETRTQHGGDARAMCNVLSDYVRLLQVDNRLDEVEPLYPELIAAAQQVYGPQHDNTLVVRGNHAMLLLSRGKKKEALASLQEVVATYEARGGPPSSEHLTMVNNLGMILNQSGRFAEAEPYLRRAGELTTQLLDPRDPNGPMIRFNHAACLAWMKRWDAAEPALLAEFEAAQQLLPEGHPVFAKMRHTIADAYQQNGRPDDATAWR